MNYPHCLVRVFEKYFWTLWQYLSVLNYFGMLSPAPLIIGNWKLNPHTNAAAKGLFLELRKKLKKDSPVEVVIAPPFPFIPDLSRLTVAERLKVGAQDVFYEDGGAFTGEVSAPMLASFAISHVIIGHSERRALGETDEVVGKKVLGTLRQKMTPVVCIGERERDDQGTFFNTIESQLRSLGTVLSAKQMSQVVLAYEPIWAIGSGKTATPENVKEMQLFIVTILTKIYNRVAAKRVRIIYGGSVKPDNAQALHAAGGMTGFLVGGASLVIDDFITIVRAVRK